MKRSSAEWTKAWDAYQSRAAMNRVRARSAELKLDKAIRSLAASCGFDPTMPILTANNWRSMNPGCADEIMKLERRSWRLHCVRDRASTTLYNRTLADPFGLPRALVPTCSRRER